MVQHEATKVPEDCDWQCLKCGYQLRGLIEPRCPECGLDFTPGEPWTYRSHQAKLEQLAREPLPTPPGRTFHRLYVASAIALLFGLSAPGGCLFPPSLGLVGLAILAAYWIAKYTRYLAIARRISRITKRPMPSRMGWAFPSQLTLVIVLLCAFEIPLRVGFILNKPFLDRTVRKVATTPPGRTLRVSWVGMYPASEVLSAWGGVRIRIDAFEQTGGFAYLPRGPHIGSSEYTLSRVWGDWYRWSEGRTGSQFGWLRFALEALE